MDQIDVLLTRGVDKIYPSKEVLEKVLRSGKKLKLYQGFDPTGTQLHIGHMVGLRKLRQWQDLGHEVIFLIGDGTGQAGDPSGKTVARDKFFSNEELKNNAREWLMQAKKIVRFEGENPIKVMFNGDWLNKLNLVDILGIAQNFSVQQLLERDMYQERIKKGETINLREFLYPLLQGYDSVAMNVDLEQGGTEQTFNMLAGRTLVANYLHKEKFVMTVPLLADSKGVKIGKSEGNSIAITDTPAELFGKIMSLGDDSIIPCFTLLTDKPLEEIKQIEKQFASGSNPIEFKKQLAFALVSQLNDPDSAVSAQEQFESTVQDHQLPTNIPEFNASSDNIVDVLVETKLAASKSEARRLIDQGGVKIDTQKVTDFQTPVKSGSVISAGSHRFVKIISA
jgi:tyrosyl-tRNA synthetase